jgi:hypothetical protein
MCSEGIFHCLSTEITAAVDAISRDALREIFVRISTRVGNRGVLRPRIVPFIMNTLPPLSEDDKRVVDSMTKLINFLLEDLSGNSTSFQSLQYTLTVFLH